MLTLNRHVKISLLLLGAAFVFQGCSTARPVTVNSQAAEPPPGFEAMDESVQDGVHDYNAVSGGDFTTNAVAMSSGSVRVYSLDGDVPPANYTDSNAAYSGGTPGPLVSRDPNVMVYALDGGPAYYDVPAAMQTQAPPMSLQPPSAQSTGGGQIPALRQPMTQQSGSAGGAQLVFRGGDSSAAALAPARVYFKHGSARLDRAGVQTVRDVAAQQQQTNPAGLVNVEGHASTRAHVSDPVERRILNLKMSMDRAYEVSSTLIRQGVPATAIRTTAYGDTRPVAGQGADDESASRRVEISAGR